MRLVPAEGALLEQILDDTFALWHEGLSRSAYARWNAAQLQTPWGREHLRRVALVDDDGGLLASAKCYRFRARLNGQPVRASGLGAVFTSPDRRGRGFSSRLIELLLDEERRAGSALALLFSEIGAAFYERLGFAVVPLEEATVRVAFKPGAPAILVRAGHESDLREVAAMHERRLDGVGFALERDPALVHYALSKKRLLAGLGPPGLRQVEFAVAEEGASAVAYVVLQQNANGWTLEEAGDRDPSGARLGAILQTLVARDPARPAPMIRAWWPAALPVPPQVELIDRSPARDLLMVRALADGVTLPAKREDVFFWHGDHF